MILPVALLAGGLAKRMRPLTEEIPKALLDVAGEPFIFHQLRFLAEQGAGVVVVCGGYLGEMIRQAVGGGERFGLTVGYSFDWPNLLGTAGAIRRAIPLLGEAFFVQYGDSYLTCDYGEVQESFRESGRLGMMTVFRNLGQWDRSNVAYENGRILTYDKLNQTRRMHHIDYGLGAFRREAFDSVPADRPSDLMELYQGLLRRGELASFEMKERFYEIGSLAGLEELRRLLEGQGRREDG
jgi:N-acetyl-alpha-D-muramate 1-phosphate uridylyltransferase